MEVLISSHLHLHLGLDFVFTFLEAVVPLQLVTVGVGALFVVDASFAAVDVFLVGSKVGLEKNPPVDGGFVGGVLDVIAEKIKQKQTNTGVNGAFCFNRTELSVLLMYIYVSCSF